MTDLRDLTVIAPRDLRGDNVRPLSLSQIAALRALGANVIPCREQMERVAVAQRLVRSGYSPAAAAARSGLSEEEVATWTNSQP